MSGGQSVYLDSATARSAAIKMSRKKEFKPTPPTQDVLYKALLEKIPFLTGFMRSINDSGSNLSKLLVEQGSHTVEKIFRGFQVASVVRATIDLVRIPIIFLAAWWLKVDLPFKLSDGCLFVYAIAIFVLTLAALLAPVSISPFLGLTASVLGLLSSFYFFAKLLYDSHVTDKRLKQIKTELDEAKDEYEPLRLQADVLAQKSLDDPTLAKEVEQLKPDHNRAKNKVQGLMNEQAMLMAAWETELGLRSSVDKIVGMSLAVLSFSGTVVCFFNPLGGLILLSIAALATTCYLVASVGSTLVTYLIEKYSDVPGDSADRQPIPDGESQLKPLLLVLTGLSDSKGPPSQIEDENTTERGSYLPLYQNQEKPQPEQVLFPEEQLQFTLD